MSRAVSLAWAPSWQGALSEALSAQDEFIRAYSDGTTPPPLLRIRKRRGTRHGPLVWRVYYPTGDIPDE